MLLATVTSWIRETFEPQTLDCVLVGENEMQSCRRGCAAAWQGWDFIITKVGRYLVSTV